MYAIIYMIDVVRVTFLNLSSLYYRDMIITHKIIHGQADAQIPHEEFFK